MTLVGQFQQGAFTVPVNSTPSDATQVLGNDNALRGKFNSHDADPTIHVQSSSLAGRPAAGVANRYWVTSDGLRAYFDTGAAWVELAYLPTVGGTVTGATTFSSTLTATSLTSAITGSGTTGTIADTFGYAIVNASTLVVGGIYLVNTVKVGTPASKCVGIYTVGASTSSSYTQIITGGGLTMLTFNGDLQGANSTGSSGTFTYAYLRLG